MSKIVDILQEVRPEEDFSASQDYINDGMLDSFDIVALVHELDTTFGISIDGTDILPENFKNEAAILTLLKKKGVEL